MSKTIRCGGNQKFFSSPSYQIGDLAIGNCSVRPLDQDIDTGMAPMKLQMHPHFGLEGNAVTMIRGESFSG